MIQKIKTILFSLSFALMGLVPALALASGVAFAVDPSPIQGNLCQGADLNLQTVGADESACASGEDINSFQGTLSKIINVISIIVGVVAVIMIIIGGFRYIVSGGKQESVTAAKNTILYGLIGLIIVALAQVIVRFVLKETSSAA